jgi:hypothetical protein
MEWVRIEGAILFPCNAEFETIKGKGTVRTETGNSTPVEYGPY